MEKKQKEQKFHLGDILSISTGILMSPEKPPIKGVYNILNFMTGDDLYTHQIPRATRFCQSHLLIKQKESLPFLKFIPKEDLEHRVNSDNFRCILDDLVNMYGEYHIVQSIEEGWETRDPIKEAQEMMGDKPVIVVAK